MVRQAIRDIADLKLGKVKSINNSQIRVVQRIPIPTQVILSKEQSVLNELFNGERTFGTGNNLPKINGVLRTGYGLINNEDFGDTRRLMF